MGAQDISWFNLMFGYLLLLIPIGIFKYYQVGLTKSMLISMLRMSIQLFLVGLYLKYLFQLNDLWINVGWVLLMILVTASTIVRRSKLPRKLLFIPVLLALIISIALVDAFLLGVVLRLEFIFEARYLIPITGMLIGNSLTNTIIAIDNFYSRIQQQQNTYRFALANGATQQEAVHIFIRQALRKALNPSIASTAVMGIVSLPGMMTGQILGGSDPSVAIKYQILIMLTIFVSSLLTIILSILFCNQKAFDACGNLNSNFLK
ncbi:MAG: iron export ABC transporter permease subunit FetB [Bacteroidales bacterium]